MLKREAKEITGGLSAPGKMPEGAWSIPASTCKLGSKLAQIPNTVCNKCYALKVSRVEPPKMSFPCYQSHHSVGPPWVFQGLQTTLQGVTLATYRVTTQGGRYLPEYAANVAVIRGD